MAVGKTNQTNANVQYLNRMSVCCNNFSAQSLLEMFFYCSIDVENKEPNTINQQYFSTIG